MLEELGSLTVARGLVSLAILISVGSTGMGAGGASSDDAVWPAVIGC